MFVFPEAILFKDHDTSVSTATEVQTVGPLDTRWDGQDSTGWAFRWKFGFFMTCHL